MCRWPPRPLYLVPADPQYYLEVEVKEDGCVDGLLRLWTQSQLALSITLKWRLRMTGV